MVSTANNILSDILLPRLTSYAEKEKKRFDIIGVDFGLRDRYSSHVLQSVDIREAAQNITFFVLFFFFLGSTLYSPLVAPWPLFQFTNLIHSR
jgi:hypothetical protein